MFRKIAAVKAEVIKKLVEEIPGRKRHLSMYKEAFDIIDKLNEIHDIREWGTYFTEDVRIDLIITLVEEYDLPFDNKILLYKYFQKYGVEI